MTSSNVDDLRSRDRIMSHTPTMWIRTPSTPNHLYRFVSLASEPAMMAATQAAKRYDWL